MLRFIALLAVSLLVSGCNQQALLEKFSTPADQAEARSVIDQLRKHEYAGIESAINARLKSENLHATLVEMAGMVPAGDPDSVKLVGAHLQLADGRRTVNSTFEYGFGPKWMLINVAMEQDGKARTISGFNITPETLPLELQNRFTLAHKSPLHYGVLGAAIFAVLLTLFALVACIRTRLPGRKWPWVLFILFGFGKFALNWSTGEWNFLPVSFQLLSASYWAALYGPWTIAVSVPVGAITFLCTKWRRGQTKAVDSATSPASLTIS